MDFFEKECVQKFSSLSPEVRKFLLNLKMPIEKKIGIKHLQILNILLN